MPLPPPRPRPSTPPLETGDRLTRAEFERRYDAMPDLKKAELIEGVVYVPSPTRFHRHGRPHVHLLAWLGLYEAGTPGVLAGGDATTRLDLDNEPQPDGLLMIDPARGGQAQISADDYVTRGPELVAEVSASSASIDLNAKLDVYRRNGVREYIVWRVLDQEVDWFVLRDDQYQRLTPDGQGVVRSEVFPGLWLDVPALLRADLPAVFTTLQRGLGSPEHADFVSKLNP
jgi:hypothetical protein